MKINCIYYTYYPVRPDFIYLQHLSRGKVTQSKKALPNKLFYSVCSSFHSFILLKVMRLPWFWGMLPIIQAARFGQH